MEVSLFERPNGDVYRIQSLKADLETNSVLIELNNGVSRWFKGHELVIDPPFIRMAEKKNIHSQ